MFDSELQARSALCYWPKGVTADGTISTQDSISLLGGYPFDVENENAERERFTFFMCNLVSEVLEITLRYRK
jgi:hypothetical protein